MRIDRVLAHIGLGTRSEVKAMIAKGRVSLPSDGIITDPAYQIADGAELTVDGMPYTHQTYHYVMLYKPEGVLTATTDSRARTVMDLLPALYKSCGASPVGRLDKDVTGLLIITNDGQLAHRLISPKYGIPKEYLAVVSGRLTNRDVSAFREGLTLSDFDALPAELTILTATDYESCARLIIKEGKFHQVKRMFASVGKPVLCLKRLSIGGVTLDDTLSPGEWRPLTREELSHIERC